MRTDPRRTVVMVTSRVFSLILLAELQVALLEMSSVIPHRSLFGVLISLPPLWDALHPRRMRPADWIHWALRASLGLSLVAGAHGGFWWMLGTVFLD